MVGGERTDVIVRTRREKKKCRAEQLKRKSDSSWRREWRAWPFSLLGPLPLQQGRGEPLQQWLGSRGHYEPYTNECERLCVCTRRETSPGVQKTSSRLFSCLFPLKQPYRWNEVIRCQKLPVEGAPTHSNLCWRANETWVFVTEAPHSTASNTCCYPRTQWVIVRTGWLSRWKWRCKVGGATAQHSAVSP